MKIVYDPGFIKKLKKANVKIRKSAKEKLRLFSKDPYDPRLDNHALKRQWKGYRSIDITVDYRAIYKETQIGNQIVAYFVAIGTHKELYK